MNNAQGISIKPDDGPELIAILLAVGLWGITCVQTLFYFVHFSQDAFILRATVIWLWLVDSIHQLLLVSGVYAELITHFCDYEEVFEVNTHFLWQVLLTTLVALPSQLFFVNRIAKFSGKRWLFFVIWAPAAMFELAGVIAFVTFGTITPTLQEIVSRIPTGLFTTVQATAAVVDLSITTGLIYLLWRSREDAQYRMRTIIQRLLLLSLGTGVWTALFAIGTVITMLVFRGTRIYVGFYFPLCPLYCNTVLVNLNARHMMGKLERRPMLGSMTFLRDTESSDHSVTLGRSNGLDQDGHELSLGRAPRCRCLRTNYARMVETGVQASRDSTGNEEFV